MKITMKQNTSIGEYRLDELKHFGILGQKWGRRRFQNKDGTWTNAGKKRYDDDDIRDETNLVEKTIPKGTVMYRTTAESTDSSGNKSIYVSYKEADRNLYKEGSDVKRYVGKGEDDDVYEHTYELKSDLKVPSLKKIRQIEKEAMEDPKLLEEVNKSYIKMKWANEMGVAATEYDEVVKLSSKIKSIDPDDKEAARAIYRDCVKKYGDYQGDVYYYAAKGYETTNHILDKNDHLTIEQSLGLAVNTKQYIIDRLKKEGYNAMYDNASIGVKSDGSRADIQEGVEPLIVFDRNEVLNETNTAKINKSQQEKAGEEYRKWKEQISS